ncbi:hypothetical protein KHQ81_05670 [Mycoplasmatota bacterium]|nr:hypothetical protein KHQ81_05670 [Mycoplasmatota bacterium]
MNKKFIYRVLTWTVLVVVLTFVTIYNYRIFVTNSVKKDIEKQEAINKEYEGKYGHIQSVINKIDQYNDKVYDDNKYADLIPDYYDSKEILSKYVNRPILLSNAELLSVSLSEAMPANIKWSNNSNTKDIKGIKVSVTFDIEINNLDVFINELQTSLRCIYFGDIKYTLSGENAPDNEKIKVNMIYFLFYRDVEKTT